jgi:hypothetical protein
MINYAQEKLFKERQIVQSSFDLPADGKTNSVSLCGDLNDWDPGVQPLKRRKD